jgi:hypothetical protein
VKVGKRTAKLLREAIVLAFAEGSQWGRATTANDPHLRDSAVVKQVLAASTSFRDLYPTLSSLDESRSSADDLRYESIQRIKHLMTNRETT